MSISFSEEKQFVNEVHCLRFMKRWSHTKKKLLCLDESIKGLCCLLLKSDCYIVYILLYRKKVTLSKTSCLQLVKHIILYATP